MSSRRSLSIFGVGAAVLAAGAFATLGTPAQAATSSSGHQLVALAGGGHQVVDSCGSSQHVAVIPPASFDPLKATAAALARYGYPPRPSASDQAELATWTHYVTHPITRVTGCSSSAPIGRHAPHPGAGGSQIQPFRDSLNWDGWVADGHKYGEVDGHIKVPHITGVSGTESVTSELIAIGQGTSAAHPIVQAGIDAYWDGTQPQFDSWWDYNSTSYDYTKDFAVDVKTGDDLYFDVTLSATGIGRFHLVDETTGVDGGIQQKTVKGASPDGTAEWIVTRPQTGGDDDDPVFAPLAHFSQLVFSAPRGKAGSTWYTLLKEAKYPETMYSTDGTTTLGVHNSVQSTNLFSPAWKSYGP